MVPFDWKTTLFSQYANSPVILKMIEDFSESVDPSVLIDTFYVHCFDLTTADNDWGLDVWGRIVGVQRVIPVAASKYFGFHEAGNISADPFGQSPFYSGNSTELSFPLSNPAFLLLIYAKAAANIWDGSIPGFNRILRILFPNNAPYVQDNQNMTMTVVLGFSPSPVQQSILFNTNVLPHPTGVSINFA